MSKHSDLLNRYISSISSKFSHEETSEMGYRTEFENLIKAIFEEINVRRIDHDAKAKDGNKPDFAVLKNDIPILYIEAKDIGISLDKVEKSEQMSRYYGYTNLVLTDYLEFRFYRNGLPYGEQIKVATHDTKNRTIYSIPEQYDNLARTLLEFTQSEKEPIRSGKHLSKIMGGKAQRIRDNARLFFSGNSEKNTELNKIYETIKKLLVHDLDKDSFADMYAQTLVYGLFVARYYDNSQENFTRKEARDLIPESNPFLRRFFDHIIGPDFDKRLEYIVNELCEVLSHADIPELMKEYFKTDLWGETHKGPDPVIHFYEDFLKEYDPELRKKMGAFYTPLPVVQFIVRSVDVLLKKDFGLAGGLADTTKTKAGAHNVQILDPAVGTGTFISNIILSIYQTLKNTGQEGRWHPYVLHDLLPRLFGFELMMTPYTIAHLKLSLAFKETGFKYFNNRRLGIYLTNALEESSKQEGLFSSFGLAETIAEESKEAGKIKNEKPIMVVIGNPPYSVSSSNKGEWIQNLIKVYKENLNEKKINLDDDYIKFIRFAEHFVEKNNTGIVAMITNNSFIDGITHRQMRKHLLETFDDIYILDLHGNTKKKEKSPDDGNDENVFDIQQGVSINIFVRKNSNKIGLGNVHHIDLFGKRTKKFAWLDANNIQDIKWKIIDCVDPYYFFVPKDFSGEATYNSGFKLDDLFLASNSGIKTDRDSLFIDFDKNHLEERINKLLNGDIDQTFKNQYRIIDSSSYKLTEKLKLKSFDDNFIQKIQYRPFDYRWVYYDPSLISRPAQKVFKHMVSKDNIAIVSCRQQSTFDFQHIFLTKEIVDVCAISLQTKETGYVFPLLQYNENGSKISNFKEEIVNNFIHSVGDLTPEDIFNYIYATLHSFSYRKKFKELLKIDFPRIPYPKDKISFEKLVMLGSELRQLHVMESPKVNQLITSYPVSGTDGIDKIDYRDGNIYINSNQYFGHVPEVAWNFFVGGYQPVRKWLKDRKGRTLTNEDIEHYQKIIVALVETDKIMKEIDKVVTF